MSKILFLDVDMTIVDNVTSEYNVNLIKFIQDHPFDQIYLVTGRNVNDLWQHVLQQGHFVCDEWRKQLLHNIISMLKAYNIVITGISTPYDHYLHAAPGKSKFSITKAGDSAEQFYIDFEKKIGDFKNTDINLNLLCDTFDKATGYACYIEVPGGKANCFLRNSLGTYLAMTDDTEKKGQFSFLLSRLERETPCELELFFSMIKLKTSRLHAKYSKREKKLTDESVLITLS